MKRYRFLLFDLDNTLLDFNADMVMAFEALYRAQGWDKSIPYSGEMLDRYESHNQRWWRTFEQGGCSKEELFLGRFRDFLRETGLPGDPAPVNDMYFDFLGRGGVPFPGALDMIKKLSEQAEVYVTTNGNAATARTRVRNSGLLPLIRDYFVSEAIGFAKPDVRYFSHVMEHIPGFEKESALVVGDSLVSDIRGAVNAGLDSLWYHPGGESLPAGAPSPTYEAGSFEEILDLLLP